MNRKILAIVLLCVLGLFSIGWFLGYFAVPSQSAKAHSPETPPSPGAKGIDIALLKARWGLEFTPAEANVQPQITKEQALNNAYTSNPLLRQATSVEFQLGYLRNPAMLEATQQGDKVLSKMADSGLAWILIFEGYPSVSSGPAGSNTVHGHSNEINYVISAITGEYIQAFIYR
jgi:hypothetical protein